MFVSFSFNDTAPTDIYTLSLHDALPIFFGLLFVLLITVALAMKQFDRQYRRIIELQQKSDEHTRDLVEIRRTRSEEHTSELQSLRHLVCRLLLEKKKLR